MGILGTHDILNTILFKLSMAIGLFDSFNFNVFIFILLIVSIFLIVNDRSKNWFLAISFIISYALSYFLYATSILNVFLYSNYIWIINLVIGLTAIRYGIINIYNYNKKNGIVVNIVNSMKSNVKIDVPLPLLFSMVFLAFILNSMNFTSSTLMTSRLLFAISASGATIFSYYFYIATYTMFFTATLVVIISLSVVTINRYVGVRYSEYTTSVGSIMLILSGLVIMFL